MHTKRINNLGRIVIPKDILEIFQLKEGDLVDIMHNEKQIIIEPHKQRFVCAVTGKVADAGIQIGDAWISKEGMKKIVKYISSE
ncbi:MAG: AbrB/MazE/SpoVT family DNA-binding domain-containing protein [Planococcus donghaensis]